MEYCGTVLSYPAKDGNPAAFKLADEFCKCYGMGYIFQAKLLKITWWYESSNIFRVVLTGRHPTSCTMFDKYDYSAREHKNLSGHGQDCQSRYAFRPILND